MVIEYRVVDVPGLPFRGTFFYAIKRKGKISHVHHIDSCLSFAHVFRRTQRDGRTISCRTADVESCC